MNTESIHWCRVAKSLPQFAFHFVWGREIELLEQFRRNGNTTCCPDMMQRGIGINRSVEVEVPGKTVAIS